MLSNAGRAVARAGLATTRGCLASASSPESPSVRIASLPSATFRVSHFPNAYARFSTSSEGSEDDRSTSVSSGRSHPTDKKTGVKSTLPSSTEPLNLDESFDKLSKKHKDELDDGDRGYLAFTKASLFKLTLPLFPPDPKLDPSSLTSKASSPLSRALMAREARSGDAKDAQSPSGEDSQRGSSKESWEERVEQGEELSQVESPDASTNVERTGKGGHPIHSKHAGLKKPENGDPSDDQSLEFDSKAPAKSVVFLLHSGQPLSYIASLIRAEEPSYHRDSSSSSSSKATDETLSKHDYEPTISFHTRKGEPKRWSPATGIGDFLRDAARIGSFVVKVGQRRIEVAIPSFENRTRFLRSSLTAKTARLEQMAQLKAECDRLAHGGTRKFAYAGAGVLVSWWCAVCYVTFFTSYGWTGIEPVVYLMGLASFMAGYSFFLFARKDVSPRSVLKETTSQAQTRLYLAKGFDADRYVELIEEAKELRRAIKKVAEDYDLEWDQGETLSGKKHKKALEVVRKSEEREMSGRTSKEDEDEEEEDDDDDEEEEEDDDDDEQDVKDKPASRSRSSKKSREKVKT